MSRWEELDTPKDSGDWAAQVEESETSKAKKSTGPAWGATKPPAPAKSAVPEDEFPELGAEGSAKAKTPHSEERPEGRGRRDDRGFDRRDDRGFDRRDDRGGYDRRDDRGGYDRGYDRRDGGYRRDDRGGRGYDRRDDRGGYDRGYDRHDDRGGYDRRREEEREPVPLPTSPPYTAFCGNLFYGVTEGDLADFFEEAKCRVTEVRLFKGFGYVEFEDLDSLKEAIKLKGLDFRGRRIKVDVAEPKTGGRSDKPRSATRSFFSPSARGPSAERNQSRFAESSWRRNESSSSSSTASSSSSTASSRPYRTAPPTEKKDDYNRPTSIFGSGKPRAAHESDSKPDLKPSRTKSPSEKGAYKGRKPASSKNAWARKPAIPKKATGAKKAQEKSENPYAALDK